MSRSDEINAITKESDKAQEESFRAFIDKPEIKALMSVIPGQESVPEALESLLRSAFASGYSSGSGFILYQLVTRMLQRRDE